MEITNQNSPVVNPGVYYPQDFSLKKVNFLTASGQRIDLKKLMIEFSYFEDIYSFVTSGYITVTDAQGFIELLQLTGNEYIEINFGKIKNGKNSTDQLFRAYKIGGRKPSGNMNSEVYTIYFCSEEMIVSEQSKISKSFKGEKISNIVKNVLTEKLLVQNDRIDTIEETMGVYDFIIPRMKPFEAISWVSTYARPNGSGEVGADMLFFETKNGYNFRSLQSMFKDDTYATYRYEQKNINDKIQDIQEKATVVLNYELTKPFDALSAASSGTFANRLISIDPLTRSFNVTDFNYEQYREQAKSLNDNGILNKLKNRLGETQNQSFEGVLKVATSNANQQNVPYIKEKQAGFAKDIFIETYLPNRTAQISLINYTTLKAAIPGDPGITAGRTINFNLFTLKPSNNKKELDRFYSGKYLVTAVRHIIQSQGIYQTILELAKESSDTEYMAINNESSTWKEAVSE